MLLVAAMLVGSRYVDSIIFVLTITKLSNLFGYQLSRSTVL